jgi:hypothetical protein
MIRDREEIIQLLGKYSSPINRLRVKLSIFFDENNLFDYMGLNKKIVINTKNEQLINDIHKCFDLSGLSSLNTTIMKCGLEREFDSKSTENEEWAKWFLKTISANAWDYLILDTNMIMRHYCSKILFRNLRTEGFNQLKFKIPRLTILEIERRVNDDNIQMKEKRLAFYAMREIMILQDLGGNLLPDLDNSLLTSFAEKSGTKFTDAFIRREIHEFRFPKFRVVDSREKVARRNCYFLTCDLMNGLAAYAEGLNTCYFSRIDKGQFFVENLEELADLIIITSIIFEKIKLEVYYGDKCVGTHKLEGMWSGKTPYHWNKDCLKEID